MYKEQDWNYGVFNEVWSTNWYARQESKWWMIVKVCDWCMAKNDIVIWIQL